jgi:hypothetical protein
LQSLHNLMLLIRQHLGFDLFNAASARRPGQSCGCRQ